MKRLILTALLASVAGQASALSCLFGDGSVAFTQAQTNGEPFRAVIGSITWGSPAPETYNGGFVMEYEGQEYDVPARFVGKELLANGETVPIEHDIRVYTWCANGDCGYARAGVEVLTFLHDTEAGIIMNATPCQSYPMGPSSENIASVQSCLDGGPCSGTLEY